MEQEYLADQAAIQKEMKQIQADIDAIYAANAGNGSQVDYSTTGFIYPVKGYTYISSYYGWRFNNTDYHTGIDFRHLPIRPFAPQPPAPSFMCVPVRVTAGHGATAIILSLTMAAVFHPVCTLHLGCRQCRRYRYQGADHCLCGHHWLVHRLSSPL